MQPLLPLLATPHYHATCFVLVSGAVAAALIAIWAARTRVHWFWRAFAVWIAAAALVPMRAYELAGIAAITLPIIAVAINLLERRSHAAQNIDKSAATPSAAIFLRFGLRDIFIVTLVSALMLFAVLEWWRAIHRLESPPRGVQWAALLANFGLAGTAYVVLTSIAYRLVTGKHRVLMLVVLVAAISIFAAAISALGATPVFGMRIWPLQPWHSFGADSRASFVANLLPVAIGLSEYALILVAALVLLKPITDSPPTRSTVIRLTPIALVALLLITIYVQMLRLTPLPPPFAGGTNHYERLTEIVLECERLAKTPNPANDRQRDALVDEAVVLLEASNFIPHDPAKDCANSQLLNRFTDRHNRFRLFARQQLDAKAEAASKNNDSEAATNDALAEVRMGSLLQRGGVYIDMVFVLKTQLDAQKRLAAMRRDLPANESRRVIAAIERVQREAEANSDIVVRSRAFEERAWGWSIRLSHIIEDFGFGGQGFADLGFFANVTVAQREVGFELLKTDLAIRLYHRDHGVWPETVDQLVPDYLPALPIDPHSGKSLIYRARGDSFVLYSVGKDRTDNGGRFNNAAIYRPNASPGATDRGYDLDLGTFLRP